MPRNIVASLVFLLFPLPAVAGPVEDCIANYHREVDAISSELEEARTGARLGWVHHQPDLTGLAVTEENYSRTVRNVYGRPVAISATRWHYTDADGKQVTLLDFVSVDQKTEQRRAEALSERLGKYQLGPPGVDERCRMAFTDP